MAEVYEVFPHRVEAMRFDGGVDQFLVLHWINKIQTDEGLPWARVYEGTVYVPHKHHRGKVVEIRLHPGDWLVRHPALGWLVCSEEQFRECFSSVTTPVTG